MKKFITMRRMTTWALSACLLVSVVSCGSDDDDSSSSSDAQPEQQTVEGIFTAELTAENASVVNPSGTAEFTVAGDDFSADVQVTGASAGSHQQHIHVGTRCPTAADDTNADGVIDATEASAVYGPPLITLDSDLAGDGGNFPSGMNYRYSEDAALTELLTSIGASTLDLSGLVVNIHGVPEATPLPDSVQGSKADFPIACGTLSLSGSGTTTGDTGTTTGDTGTTTGDTGTTTGDTGTTTGDTGTTTGDTGTTTGGTGTTTGGTGTTTGGTTTATVY